MSAILPVLPYLPVSAEGSEGLNYDSRDGKRHGRGSSYAGGYSSSDYASGDGYGSYGSSQVLICDVIILHIHIVLDLLHIEGVVSFVSCS